MKRTIMAFVFLPAFLLGFTASGREGPAQNVAVAVKDVEPFTYCSLSHRGPVSDIQDVIGQLILDMQSQGLLPMGPMIAIFQGDPTFQKPDSMEWEVGFPVVEQASIQAPLGRKQWIFKTVAWAMHVGPYEKTGETIGQILTWMDANGYSQGGPVVEQYADMDPKQIRPENMKTEIWVPCFKKGG
jgi:effector-binding domain-containing protein